MSGFSKKSTSAICEPFAEARHHIYMSKLEETLSGQHSPAADAKREYQLSPDPIVLQNEEIEARFDPGSGALILLAYKRTGWMIQRRPSLGESFRAFVPVQGRNYNPVLGAKNRLSSFKLTENKTRLILCWNGWESEYAGRLDVSLRAVVELKNSILGFSAEVINRSRNRIDSVSWPILGDIGIPEGETSLTRDNLELGTLKRTQLYPFMMNERGYWGTNFPTQINGRGNNVGLQIGGANFFNRYVLISATNQGVYLGTHEIDPAEVVNYVFELKPGYTNSVASRFPKVSELNGHPVRLSAESVHLAFVAPDETRLLSQIVIAPYQGTWHAGVDIYKEWRSTWFLRPVAPGWTQKVHSWQQVQINSSEGDLRTPFRQLRRRARQLARHGVGALQLVGWNAGGQDRGNPSHSPEPRLGTWEELKEAIAEIEAMGIRVVLFNKYTWLEMTTEAYARGLKAHAAVDPYGIPYSHPGYEYQTPMQLAGINTRRFAVACMNDASWRDLCEEEFRKSVELGASGILYDEAFHHWSANFCFSSEHRHRVPATLWSGDLLLGQRLRDVVRRTAGEERFLLAGEVLFDLQYQHYSLSYFRVSQGHIPAERYADPFHPMMIAVTGFDDREMINRALLYRYILSYEPFHFKGDLEDFPSTLAYGKRVDAFRETYAAYLWDAEFRDTRGAHVNAEGSPAILYSVFQQPASGLRAVVIVNDESEAPAVISLALEGGARRLCWATPEEPVLRALDYSLTVPPRSACMVAEQ
jgi:hypothetical protein